jgi:RNA polymerase sigma-70 factor (ECF subfamily)
MIRIVARDESAFRILIGRYRPTLRAFVRRRVADRQHVEDLVNDTLLTVWLNAERFEGRSALPTWILAIARYKLLNVKSRFCAPTQPLTEALLETLIDKSDRPDDGIARAQTAAIVRQCLSTLSSKHVKLLQLVYYEDKSIQDVARIVGIPPNTVKSRMFLARRQLGDLLVANGLHAQ